MPIYLWVSEEFVVLLHEEIRYDDCRRSNHYNHVVEWLAQDIRESLFVCHGSWGVLVHQDSNRHEAQEREDVDWYGDYRVVPSANVDYKMVNYNAHREARETGCPDAICLALIADDAVEGSVGKK